MLLPKAIVWATERATEVAKIGRPLDDEGIAIARRVGVADPVAVRIKLVERLPVPRDPQLHQAALLAGLIGPQMAGITFGHSIYICIAHNSVRLLSHECRHVHQYEHAGSIAGFLRVYLPQIVNYGYANAPLEIDARAHEV
jgi:hypothetical protein